MKLPPAASHPLSMNCAAPDDVAAAVCGSSTLGHGADESAFKGAQPFIPFSHTGTCCVRVPHTAGTGRLVHELQIHICHASAIVQLASNGVSNGGEATATTLQPATANRNAVRSCSSHRYTAHPGINTKYSALLKSERTLLRRNAPNAPTNSDRSQQHANLQTVRVSRPPRIPAIIQLQLHGG